MFRSTGPRLGRELAPKVEDFQGLTVISRVMSHRASRAVLGIGRLEIGDWEIPYWELDTGAWDLEWNWVFRCRARGPEFLKTLR